MKIGCVTIAFNEEPLVKGCIETVAPFVDEHLFLVSEKPYYGKGLFEKDRTAEVAEECGATVVEGFWEKEHEQRNVGAKYFSDKDWIFWTDVDMWGTSKYWSNLIEELHTAPDEVEAIVTEQYSLWKEPFYYLIEDDFRPVIATRPSVRFWKIGCVDVKPYVFQDHLHHLAWSKPKDVYKKVLTYSHANAFDGDKWYKENWENWKWGDRVQCTEKGVEYTVGKIDVPEEFRGYL